MQLVCGNALFRRIDEVERLQPDMQLDMAAFHHALGGDGKILAAFLRSAAVDARLFGGEGAVDRPAMWAHPLSAPAQVFKIGAGGVGALKVRSVEARHGVTSVLRLESTPCA